MGVPLAGYNHGERRVPDWPLVEETKYTTVSCVLRICDTITTGITIGTAKNEPCRDPR